MRRTHGQSGTKLYWVWKEMRQRCNNPNNRRWRDYGGRGICVCSAWNRFENFASLAKKSDYKPGLQLDRRNTDGNYCPSNCRWVTFSVGCQNRRAYRDKSSRFIGVGRYRDGRRWVAWAKAAGKTKHLGLFVSEVEAARARDAYVRANYDSFATLNEV